MPQEPTTPITPITPVDVPAPAPGKPAAKSWVIWGLLITVASIVAPKYVPILKAIEGSWDTIGMIIGQLMVLYGRLKPEIQPIVAVFKQPK